MTGLRTRSRPTARLYAPDPSLAVRAPLLPVHRYLDLPRRNDRPDPLVQAAIAVGSEALGDALQRRDGGGARGGARRADSLLRYLIRCSTRPTPFGLFAGIAVAEWADTTDLRIADRPRPTRTRPDMGWLIDLVHDVEPGLRDELRLVANRCAFERGGRLYLSERATGDDGADVSVRATPVVRRVLAAARTPVARSDR